MSKEAVKNENINLSIDDSSKPKFKHCFIITPIGEPNSEVNLKAFGLINAVMRPVLREHGYEPVAASDISLAGSINKQILKHIYEDELVIANLTGLNPNVMYELAVRHAVKKPIIIMAEKGTKLPFDVVDQRCVFYDDTFSGVEAAKKLLFEFISSAISSEDVISNPIYDSINEAFILKEAVNSNSPDVYIINRIDKLENLISSLLKPNVTTSPKSFYRNLSPIFKFKLETTYTNAMRELLDKFIHEFGALYNLSYSFKAGTNMSIFEIQSTQDIGDILLSRIKDSGITTTFGYASVV